ncbi:hypothetical protein PENSPDRAFT_433150 [Peniophora sp. CONT]|nr:hypothetical protein PENSPDRAFT_433150 [Peniophora sp. CONT]
MGEDLWIHWDNKDIRYMHPRVQDEATGAWILEGVTSAQLDAFMSVLYPEDLVTFDIEGQETWVEVLKLANSWESHSIRKLAISRLGNPRPDKPMDLLVLARLYHVDEWTRAALIALCMHPLLPERDELRNLNKEDLLLLCTLRATCGDNPDEINAELDSYFLAESVKAEEVAAQAFADEGARIHALAEAAANARALDEEARQREREELEAELARLAMNEGFEPVVPEIQSPVSAILAPGEHPLGFDAIPIPFTVEERPLTPAPTAFVSFTSSPCSVSAEPPLASSLLTTPQQNLTSLPSNDSSPTAVGSGSEQAAPYLSPSAKGGRWLGEGGSAVWTGLDSLAKSGGLRIDTDTPGQRSTNSALTARPGLLSSVMNFLSPGSTTAVGTGDFGFAPTPIAGGWPQEDTGAGAGHSDGPALVESPVAENGDTVASPEPPTPAVPEIQVQSEAPSPTSTSMESISEEQDLESTEVPERVVENVPERQAISAKDDRPRDDTQESGSSAPTPGKASGSRPSGPQPPSESLPETTAGTSAGGRTTPEPTSKAAPPPPKASKKRRKTIKRRATESSATAPILA